MAKRVRNSLRPHEVMEEEEDMGLPGKLYFPKPQLVLVESKHKPLLPEFDVGPTGHAEQKLGPPEYYTTEGPCRLKSSHTLSSYVPPETVKYLLSQRPLQKDADDYIGMFKLEGFGEGAIVTRRYTDKWRTDWHTNWGIITRVVQIVPWPSDSAWCPYRVKWFDGGVEENAWGEDLYIIHAHLDNSTLKSILEAQGG